MKATKALCALKRSISLLTTVPQLLIEKYFIGIFQNGLLVYS